MSDFISTTNMGLTVPIVGVALGPEWASEINASLVTVDSHDHSNGKGVAITPAGMNISSDLPIGSNNLTLVRSVRFQPPNSQPAGTFDLNCVYAFGVDLYYRDGNGNQVRITQSGGVTGATGNITSLASPASCTYNSGSSTFVFQSDVNTPAILDGASFILRNLSANSKGLTLAPPSAMAADYTLTLPAKPASVTSLVGIATSGVMSPIAPDGSSLTISGSTISVGAAGVTAAMMAPGLLPPSGMISAYGGASAPTGWLLCDGTSYLRATYPDLFTAISTAYGTADGSHFSVPDLRGQFLRGVTGASANDPDAYSRTANNTGGATGNNVGSQQAGALAAHTHALTIQTIGTNGTGISGSNSVPVQGSNVTGSTGGNETRPINVYVQFIIKT